LRSPHLKRSQLCRLLNAYTVISRNNLKQVGIVYNFSKGCGGVISSGGGILDMHGLGTGVVCAHELTRNDKASSDNIAILDDFFDDDFIDSLYFSFNMLVVL
jgi:hypothetical protein